MADASPHNETVADLVQREGLKTPGQLIEWAKTVQAVHHYPVSNHERAHFALALYFQGFSAGRACEKAFVEVEDNDGVLQMLARYAHQSTAALAKRVADLEAIVRVVADADSEDCVGSLDVDIPRNGYPRQWLRAAARAALDADTAA